MRKSNYNTEAQKADICKQLMEHFGSEVIGVKQLHEYVAETDVSFPYFILRERKIGRNQYDLVGDIQPMAKKSKAVKVQAPKSESVAAPAMIAQVVPFQRKRATSVADSLVPAKNNTFVPFGFYNDLKGILKSGIFYPIYITGHSGNGKTMGVEQACAQLGRELIRVNVTKTTDEIELFGSYELINGDTVRTDGPVTTAMRRGAVLLLDESDYGAEGLTCLQGVMEGKPYYDKRTGEVIHPAAGFMIVATGNTKGKGDADGRYMYTNTMNEAFLERFAITVEQDYPPAAVERKILSKNFSELNLSDDGFIDHLINWAEVIRKSFKEGAVDEVITTRRLVHIAKAYAIFQDRSRAIQMCLNRFDEDTKNAFMDLYTKVDPTANTVADAVSTEDRIQEGEEFKERLDGEPSF